jgi:hypothetical protein
MIMHNNKCKVSFQIGSEFEDEIFEGLERAMKEHNIKNRVVFSGLMLKDCLLKTLGEFDFIIISSALKSVIQIEAKRGNNEKNRDHAERQLNHGQAFFKDNVPFPSSKNWNYVKMMCFGESVEKDICEKCQPFIIGSNFIKEKTLQSVSKDIADQFHSLLKTISDGKIAGKNEIL